jgi:hypothetical protein
MPRPLGTRGAISVEYLVAFIPVMFFFTSTWQLADLYATHLLVQRAASAAGRAASVVLPDDPVFYGGAAVNVYAGVRKQHVERAAMLVLAASLRVRDDVAVSLSGYSGNGPLTATVTANLICFPGWGMFVCGADGIADLTASAQYPYHGASYPYE